MRRSPRCALAVPLVASLCWALAAGARAQDAADPAPPAAASAGSGAAGSTGAAGAAGPKPLPPAVQARLERERARCIVDRLPSEREGCLREVAAARQAALRGELDPGSPSVEPDSGDDFRRNALRRCEPLPPDDRADCEARVNGEGTTRGSVAEGGIYRELRRTIPAPAASAASAPPIGTTVTPVSAPASAASATAN